MMAERSDDLMERALIKRSGELKSGKIRFKLKKDEDGSVVKMKYKQTKQRSNCLSGMFKRWTSGKNQVPEPEKNSTVSETYMCLVRPQEDSANATYLTCTPGNLRRRTLPPLPKTDTSDTYANDNARRDDQPACRTEPSLTNADASETLGRSVVAENDGSTSSTNSECEISEEYLDMSNIDCPSANSISSSVVSVEYLDMATIGCPSANSISSSVSKYGTTTNDKDSAIYRSYGLPRSCDAEESNDSQLETGDGKLNCSEMFFDDDEYELPEFKYDYASDYDEAYSDIDPDDDCHNTLRSDDDEVTSRNDDDDTFALLPNTSEASNIEPSSLLRVDLCGTDMPPVDPFLALSLKSKASELSNVSQEKPQVVKSKRSCDNDGEEIIKGRNAEGRVDVPDVPDVTSISQITGLSRADISLVNQYGLAPIAKPEEAEDMEEEESVMSIGKKEWINFYKQNAVPLNTLLRRANRDPVDKQPANVLTTTDDIEEEEGYDRKHRLLEFYGSLRSDNHPCAPTSDLAYTDANAHTDDHGMKSLDGSVCSDRENSDAADLDFDRVAYLMNLRSDIANKTGNYCVITSSTPDMDYENTKTNDWPTDMTDGGKSQLRSDLSQ